MVLLTGLSTCSLGPSVPTLLGFTSTEAVLVKLSNPLGLFQVFSCFFFFCFFFQYVLLLTTLSETVFFCSFLILFSPFL